MVAAVRTGRVTDFDEPRGLGSVTAHDGAVLPFQCVELADGTRTIEVGAEVVFDVVRKLGRLEAVRILRR